MRTKSKARLLLHFSKQKIKPLELESYSAVYSGLGNSQVIPSEVASADEFNQVVESIRDEYTDWVCEQNEVFLKEKALFKDLSLFFLTDFSVKRTEIFKTVNTIAHCLILKKHLSHHSYDEIVLVADDVKQASTLSRYLKEYPINRIDIQGKSKSKIPPFLSTLKFFLASFIKQLGTFSLKSNLNSHQFKRSFLTRFPLHFNQNFEEDKYGSFIEKDDLVIVDILTDGMHQNLGFSSYVDACQKVSERQENFALLDLYWSPIDYLKSFILFIQTHLILKRLLKTEFTFKGIVISELVHDELKFSFMRIPRLRLLSLRLERFLKSVKIEALVYYLQEYTYGRMVSYLIRKKFSEIESIGFQHGPASYRKFLYFLSSNEVEGDDYSRNVPLPSKTLAEDSFSMRVYEKGNHKNVSLMKENYRLHYLKDIKREQTEKDSVLIACGLHDGMFIFESLKERILKESKSKFYFKLHPRANNEAIYQVIDELKLDHLVICDQPVDFYLEIVEKVIVTYSSVGLEAQSLGIPVEVLRIPGKIDESPIYDLERGL